jgi:hypothetical protein
MKKINLTIVLTGVVDDSFAKRLAIAWEQSSTTAHIPVDDITFSVKGAPNTFATFDFCQLTQLEIQPSP